MTAVFFHHYNPKPASWIVGAFCMQGFAGVQVFFVLSGFLITGILFDSRLKQDRVKTFYLRRILRIFPIYYLFGLFWFLATLLSPWRWDWNWRWLIYCVHLGNYDRLLFFNPSYMWWLESLRTIPRAHSLYFGHLWSLCVEEQFYLLWPAVVFLCRSRERLRAICIGVLVLTPLLRVLLLAKAPAWMISTELLYRSTPTQWDAMVWGGLLALLLRGPEGEFVRKHNGRIFAVCLALFCAYEVALWIVHGRELVGTTDPLVSIYGLLAYDILGVGLIVRLIHTGTELSRFFSLRWLRSYGLVTYGFYLFHDPPHQLYQAICTRLVPSHLYPATAALAFVCTLIVSLISFRWIETPFLRMKDRFAPQSHIIPTA